MNEPKRLHADIGSLRRFKLIDIWLAKKLLLLRGPVVPRSDITSKGDYLILFERNRNLKKFLQAFISRILYSMREWTVVKPSTTFGWIYSSWNQTHFQDASAKSGLHHSLDSVLLQQQNERLL